MLYHPAPPGVAEYYVEHKFEGLRIVSYITNTRPLPRAIQYDSQSGEDIESPNWVPF